MEHQAERIRCGACGTWFFQTVKTQIYCSPKCRKDGSKRKYLDTYEKKVVGTIAVCLLCGGEFLKRGSNHKYCSQDCMLQANKNTANRDKFIIFERDNFRCVYCGKSSIEDGVKLHIDHVYPKVMGGEDKAYNLVTACERCNLSKSKNPIRAQGRLLRLIKRRNSECNIDKDVVIKLTGEGGW